MSGPAIHIRSARLEAPPRALPGYRELLTPEEREHVDMLRREDLKSAYTVAHAALRLFLAEWLKCSTADLRLEIGPEGKPSLKQPRAFFNMSHSGRLAVYALSMDCDVGVDVEQVREISGREYISAAFFCEEESAELSSLPPGAESNEAFLRCWTRKEAYVKALGDGLKSPLNRFRVSLSAAAPARLMHIGGSSKRAGRWRLHHLDPAPGYIGALAYSGREREIVLHGPVRPVARIRESCGRAEAERPSPGCYRASNAL